MFWTGSVVIRTVLPGGHNPWGTGDAETRLPGGAKDLWLLHVTVDPSARHQVVEAVATERKRDLARAKEPAGCGASNPSECAGEGFEGDLFLA